MQMPLFGLDTADIKEIERRLNNQNGLFRIKHITTNPTLLRKAKPDIVGLRVKEKWDMYLRLATDISNLPDINYVSVETCGYDKALKRYHSFVFGVEARDIVMTNNNKLLVKIPGSEEGFFAIKPAFAYRTNVTLIFNIYQALKAAELGVFCISPFLGRMDDFYGPNAGLRFLEQIANEWQRRNIKDTRILAASIRSQDHVFGALNLGVHMLTMPVNVYDVFSEKVRRHLEEDELLINGLEKFKKDWFGE